MNTNDIIKGLSTFDAAHASHIEEMDMKYSPELKGKTRMFTGYDNAVEAIALAYKQGKKDSADEILKLISSERLNEEVYAKPFSRIINDFIEHLETRIKEHLIAQEESK